MLKSNVKFKRQNIKDLSNKKGVSFLSLDLLRQTSIEQYVTLLANHGFKAEDIKNIIKHNINLLLNLMIV